MKYFKFNVSEDVVELSIDMREQIKLFHELSPDLMFLFLYPTNTDSYDISKGMMW